MKVYLDTSALVKRYVEEDGTEIVDELFDKAYKNEVILVTSQFNIGEAAVVFDKYERKININAKEVFKTMINELYVLAKLGNFTLVPISYDIISDAINLIFEHHIYVADAIQLASFKYEKCREFITFDKKLLEIYKKL